MIIFSNVRNSSNAFTVVLKSEKHSGNINQVLRVIDQCNVSK